jgi:hypothetical protein
MIAVGNDEQETVQGDPKVHGIVGQVFPEHFELERWALHIDSGGSFANSLILDDIITQMPVGIEFIYGHADTCHMTGLLELVQVPANFYNDG